MELILIDSEKLKIILSGDDMKEMNITVNELDYSKVSTKQVLWTLLNKAKTETGFDADGSKLFVQVYPSNDGGCELYIIKNDTNNEKPPQKKYYNAKKSALANDGTFIIIGFSELCSLCSRLIKDSLHISTSLYFDISGQYILIIRKNQRLPSYIRNDSKIIETIPDYIAEYGKVFELTERSLAYINEHCRKIISGNAAEILAAL